jgi:hypothetical protein
VGSIHKWVAKRIQRFGDVRAVLTETSNVAFRAQLIIAEQRQLYDYWAAIAGGRNMPSRDDVSPAHFPRLLPYISLLERADSRLKVRLAGTRLRDIYEREITGLFLDDIDWGEKKSYWDAVYDHVTKTLRPAQGVVRGPRVDKKHLVQFWLRLPLSHEEKPANMILCHDTFVSAQAVPHSIDLLDDQLDEAVRPVLRV